ncbi:uncharacterized protein LOC8276530 isoform X1 [Ricinus communis]|uniref:uncharacterized protein LOC8276530 isoform X1 n=1 Tax=Ricinus communis TaxID=3988 RepID=UPI00201AFCC7|nr:uncharacterized protein LOC8276530 isoform X1 [Ricinus communis]
MGIPSEIRDYWAQTIKNKKKQISINNNNNNNNNSLWICSPAEDQRILEARRCTQEGVKAGAKAAAVAAVASAIPTLEVNIYLKGIIFQGVITQFAVRKRNRVEKDFGEDVSCCSCDSMGKGKSQLHCSSTHHLCCINLCLFYHC